MLPLRVSPQVKVKIGFKIKGAKFPLDLATNLSLEVSSVVLNTKLTQVCRSNCILQHLEKNEIIKENTDHLDNKRINRLFVNDKAGGT